MLRVAIRVTVRVPWFVALWSRAPTAPYVKLVYETLALATIGTYEFIVYYNDVL